MEKYGHNTFDFDSDNVNSRAPFMIVDSLLSLFLLEGNFLHILFSYILRVQV